jgi:hypothetical protein
LVEIASFKATGTRVPDGIVSSSDFTELSEIGFAASFDRESRNCGVPAVLLGLGGLLWAAAKAEIMKTIAYLRNAHLHPKSSDAKLYLNWVAYGITMRAKLKRLSGGFNRRVAGSASGVILPHVPHELRLQSLRAHFTACRQGTLFFGNGFVPRT